MTIEVKGSKEAKFYSLKCQTCRVKLPDWPSNRTFPLIIADADEHLGIKAVEILAKHHEEITSSSHELVITGSYRDYIGFPKLL